ncbi:MAG: NADH-quinone oxidoreductase subunit C [Anaplasma sp.]
MSQGAKLKSLKKHLSQALECKVALRDDEVLECSVIKKNLCDRMAKLKDEKFRVLTDIFAVDYPARKNRFDVVYMLLSMSLNARVCCRVQLAEGSSIPSVVHVFSTAGWFEREVFDMYGITFEGHPDMRRILTDYGFVGHPMLKDFPLTGYDEVRYDLQEQKVVYRPVDLQQDFRNFDALSPWKGNA